MANWNPVWDDTKEFEALYQNKPQDSGNYCKGDLIGTKYGISAIGLAQWNGGNCPTVEEVKNLTESKARQIAKGQYWDNIKGDKIKSQALAHLIFDITFGGSSGPLNVRQAINAVKGPGTVSEFRSSSLSDSEVDLINKLPEKDLFDRIVQIRKQFLVGNTYQAGLTNRLVTIALKYQSILNNPSNFFTKNTIPVIVVLSVVLVSGIVLIVRNKNK